jgi:WD40-like Beta Propeller Repeat
MALSTLSARSARRTSAAWLACVALISVGCSGEVVNLGSSPLEAGGSSGSAGSAPGGAAPHIWELPSAPLLAQMDGILLANPTLTAQGDLYYSQQQQQGARPDPYKTSIEHAVLFGGQWNPDPMPLTFADLDMPDISSPAVSADGNELWFGMSSGTSTDIYSSVFQGGAWAKPELATALNSAFDDVPRPPGFGGKVMPLSSKRHGGPKPLYQIYLSKRNSSGAWGEPSQASLGSINSPDGAFQSADGFLTDDGLELYFSSKRDGDSDLYVARRAGANDVFGAPEPLTDLNDPNRGTASEERMPWLSPNRDQLYFVSDRTGQYTLYVATKVAP